jgi:hypothetical protein
MNIQHKVLLLVAITVLGALTLSAQSKPNFSGTWELNLAKSDLGGAPISKLVVQMDHQSPILKYTAEAVVNGESFTESGTIDTDGKTTTDSRGGEVRAHWESTTLVIVTSDSDGNLLDTARMALSSDGKVVTREYDRQSDQQKRHEVFDKTK